VLKNALDWLVGGTEMPGKRIALLNASPRATHAQASLSETLQTMAAVIVPEACVTIPLLGRELDETAIARDPAIAESIREALGALKGAEKRQTL
jgi:NAD(P)H-dependent FMN reductase